MSLSVLNISSYPAFLPVRFQGAVAAKAGLLPFYRNVGGALHFLVAAPKAVRNPEDTPPYAIARGSRRVRLPDGAWSDLRSADAVGEAMQQGHEIEPAYLTALDEGEEELGLPRAAVRQLYDGGILAYKDYGIHFFAAEIAEDTVLHPARDSASVRWVTLAEAIELAEKNAFSRGYLPLLAAWSAALDGRVEQALKLEK